MAAGSPRARESVAHAVYTNASTGHRLKRRKKIRIGKTGERHITEPVLTADKCVDGLPLQGISLLASMLEFGAMESSPLAIAPFPTANLPRFRVYRW